MSKGSKPRNCFSKSFRDNFDEINWKKGSYLSRDLNSTFILDEVNKTAKSKVDFCFICGKEINLTFVALAPWLFTTDGMGRVIHKKCN